ncbi:hypothetical protein V1477_005492 [Vespula maculifrons]|uniref:Uncharacterized protein n=2 Tax=Vespula TaxID=7451 RepID=A0A834KFR0_VESVU|nr:hypothetical protein HZH66_001676 [Vespula vulgaris]
MVTRVDGCQCRADAFEYLHGKDFAPEANPSDLSDVHWMNEHPETISEPGTLDSMPRGFKDMRVSWPQDSLLSESP